MASADGQNKKENKFFKNLKMLGKLGYEVPQECVLDWKTGSKMLYE